MTATHTSPALILQPFDVLDSCHQQVVVTLRIDTPIEVDYYRAGGILPYVLRQLLAGS